MKRLIFTLSFSLAVSASAFAQNTRTVIVDSNNTAVPVATTTEIAHDGALGTLTLVKSLMEFCRTSSALPTDATGADRAFLVWCNLKGAQASFLTANSVGGCTPGKLVSAASTNATSVSTTASQVYLFTASNTNAAVRYLKIYDKASAPTVGTDTPKFTIALPASGGRGPDLGTPVGVSFANGIAFALTTGAADSDTGAVAASEILVNYCWK